jgi:GNAT superfamily N-acetyltransferase
MAIWFLTYSTWEGRYGIYLEDLYVRSNFRGQGIGTALLNKLAQVCQENDYTRFQWSVLDWNAKAIEVYRNVGAQPIEGWTGYRLTGEPLKALAQPQ